MFKSEDVVDNTASVVVSRNLIGCFGVTSLLLQLTEALL